MLREVEFLNVSVFRHSCFHLAYTNLSPHIVHVLEPQQKRTPNESSSDLLRTNARHPMNLSLTFNCLVFIALDMYVWIVHYAHYPLSTYCSHCTTKTMRLRARSMPGSKEGGWRRRDCGRSCEKKIERL